MKFCPLCYGQIEVVEDSHVCVRCKSIFDTQGELVQRHNAHIGEAAAAMEFKPAVNDAPVYDVKASKVIAKPEAESNLPAMPSIDSQMKQAQEFVDKGNKFEVVPLGTVAAIKDFVAAQKALIFNPANASVKAYGDAQDKLWEAEAKL